MQPCGRSNGLCFDKEGNLWACADAKNEMWRIDPAGKATVVIKDYQGKLLNGPNDVWATPDGGIYFTDPYYRGPIGSGGRRRSRSRASTTWRPTAGSWFASSRIRSSPTGERDSATR